MGLMKGRETMKHLRKLDLNIGLFLLACVLTWIWCVNSSFMDWLCVEDGIVENSEAILYLLAGLGFLLIYVKRSKNWWHLALALLFLGMAGEEINWGQRIFGIQSPEIMVEHNVQGEISLHNLDGIHQHIRFVGVIFIMLYFFLAPVLSRYNVGFRAFVDRLKLPVYPIWGLPVLTIAVVLMTYFRYVLHLTDFNMNEVGELYIALGMFFFFWSEYGLGAGDKK